MRALVGGAVARGRVELSLSLQLRQTPGVDVEFNEEFARALERRSTQARERGLVTGALTPGDLLRLPQALTIRERQPDETRKPRGRSRARGRRRSRAGAGRPRHDARRARASHSAAISTAAARGGADLVERIAVAADEGRAAMEQRLAERVRELRTSSRPTRPPSRRKSSAWRRGPTSARRSTRFRGHVSHWVALADGAEPCGRKLDFLLQEMNREVNTMGSKADGLRVSELIIAAKAELEKMREQVQNVE